MPLFLTSSSLLYSQSKKSFTTANVFCEILIFPLAEFDSILEAMFTVSPVDQKHYCFFLKSDKHYLILFS